MTREPVDAPHHTPYRMVEALHAAEASTDDGQDLVLVIRHAAVAVSHIELGA